MSQYEVEFIKNGKVVGGVTNEGEIELPHKKYTEIVEEEETEDDGTGSTDTDAE